MTTVDTVASSPSPHVPAIRPRRPATGSILFVCRANVTRSAFMHLTLRALLGKAGLEGIEVRSAGLQSVEGEAPHPQVRAWLERRSVPFEDFTSRQLVPEDLAAANLVITATRRQRDLVVRMAPRSSTKVFTLLQLHRLIGEEPDAAAVLPREERPPAHVARLAALRRGLAGTGGESDDLADPTGRRGAAFTAMFNQVLPVLHRLVAHLEAHHNPCTGGDQE